MQIVDKSEDQASIQEDYAICFAVIMGAMLFHVGERYSDS
jgi:hypothetical protein